jgi:hypothetical protein
MSHSHVVSELVVIVTINILIEETVKTREKKRKTSCEAYNYELYRKPTITIGA